MAKKGGFINYKCRRCGKVISMLHVPDVLRTLILEMQGKKDPSPGGFLMSSFQIHYCEQDMQIGICDLIGGTLDAE